MWSCGEKHASLHLSLLHGTPNDAKLQTFIHYEKVLNSIFKEKFPWNYTSNEIIISLIFFSNQYIQNIKMLVYISQI